MSNRLCLIVTLLLLIGFAATLHAQEPAQPSPVQSNLGLSSSIQATAAVTNAERAELEKKAVDLLESISGQINGLHSPENRARLASNIATLLWKYDEERARALFNATKEDLRAGFEESQPEEADDNLSPEYYQYLDFQGRWGRMQTLHVFIQLRSDIIARIAEHDPAFALEFMAATRPEMKLPHDVRNSENALRARLAARVAPKDSQLALKLGREVLAQGLSPQVLDTLSGLQQKDPAL